MTKNDASGLPVIYSTHPLHPRAAAMLDGVARLRIASRLDPAVFVAESRDAEALIIRVPVPPEIFEDAPRLRAAIRHGAGLDMVPMEAAAKAGVLVANVPGVNARTVAEYVFFAAMALLRRFRIINRDLREKGWLEAREHTLHGNELAGKTIGIVGMGDIGRQVAAIATGGFGLKVLANTRRPEGVPPGINIAFRALDDLMAEADIIAICCPLTPETRGMIDAARIRRMKPTAVIVNGARGAIIDDDALVAALRENRIGGAALDVFATQPLPRDHPYFGFDNVVLTPHMAGITEESMERMGTGAAAEAIRVLSGELPHNLRNPEVVPAYRARFPD
ncbi:MAG: hydroxyacid dehydrogenase [Rhizobiaceae bacterium]|nr:MAG: hydroxyacid dehydrogenase [Rhizobiaceae bacterium]